LLRFLIGDGFPSSFVRVVTSVHRSAYSNHPEPVKSGIKLFLRVADGDYVYRMAAVREKTDIPASTVYSWPEWVCALIQNAHRRQTLCFPLRALRHDVLAALPSSRAASSWLAAEL
jgi:hypothetical protein